MLVTCFHSSTGKSIWSKQEIHSYVVHMVINQNHNVIHYIIYYLFSILLFSYLKRPEEIINWVCIWNLRNGWDFKSSLFTETTECAFHKDNTHIHISLPLQDTQFKGWAQDHTAICLHSLLRQKRTRNTFWAF